MYSSISCVLYQVQGVSSAERVGGGCRGGRGGGGEGELASQFTFSVCPVMKGIYFPDV
jgi:hypothetical protein